MCAQSWAVRDSGVCSVLGMRDDYVGTILGYVELRYLHHPRLEGQLCLPVLS